MSTFYLLDTNAVSDLIAASHKTLQRLSLSESRGDRVFITTTVRGEILFGLRKLEHGRRRQALEYKVDSFLARCTCLAVPPAAAEHYAELKIAQQRKGLPVDENDLWIGAAAIAMGATLVSRDSDMHRIDGLRVEDWTAQ